MHTLNLLLKSCDALLTNGQVCPSTKGGLWLKFDKLADHLWLQLTYNAANVKAASK